MPGNILSVLIETTLQSSLLIAVVLLLRVLFRKTMDKRLRYALWLPVLLRLLLPFPIRCSLSLMNIFVPAAHVGATDAAILPGFAVQTSSPSFPWYNVMLVIWLFGTAVVAAVTVWGNIRFSSRLRKGCTVADMEALTSLCGQMRIRKMPKVYLSDRCVSPCAVGIFRPVIYLPPWASSSETLLRHILMHELTHIKRRDNTLALLFSVCCAVYWFHPLVWIMGYASRTDRELACDAWVTGDMSTGEKTAYGMALISALQCQSGHYPHACSSGFAARRKEMLERIRSVRNGSKTSNSVRVCVCAVMAIALTVFGTSAKAVAADNLPQEVPADTKPPAAAYVSSSAFESASPLLSGTIALFDRNTVDRLSDSLTPDDSWTESYRTLPVSNCDEYLYITIPEEGNRSHGRVYAVFEWKNSGYVYSPALPATFLRMSDEDHSNFLEVLKELKKMQPINEDR